MSAARTIDGKGPSTLTERVVDTMLDRGLPAGGLEITWPRGGSTTYEGREPGPHARVTLHDHNVARRIAREGSLGLAESYMAGEWDTPDLRAVLDLGAAGMTAGGMDGANRRAGFLDRLTHALRFNSRRGSKRNIAAHYDLGNDFYRLWLDDTMTYSAACFEEDCSDLAEAQHRKWDRILEIADPDSRSNLLEIGCGWGGFAIHAAKQAGCRVTGVTLSQEQHDFAKARVAEEGLEDRIEIRLQDYRDVSETYDRLVSIEMFEAVGEKYWPVFFKRVRELMKAGGAAALQTITIPEARFEAYRSGPDFIQRYIFPGGMLPSPERFDKAARDAGLATDEPRFIGDSYARTLDTWLQRFDAAHPEVRALGFDERFIRMWRFYLAFCRAGFSYRTIDVMQVGLRP
ncbi:MAG: cyclopropane-fatty-acyl-phospholipid synthase family protein [Anaerosomatales bacterium]|nr:cyclopropane-fatty-acyl-phospholipid synthase [Anaerosomatales bacterium]MDT8433704.1 cyclopropane-fatty-acyl-phospholipid synthase family protein [Anaerosomatales bacterium]